MLKSLFEKNDISMIIHIIRDILIISHLLNILLLFYYEKSIILLKSLLSFFHWGIWNSFHFSNFNPFPRTFTPFPTSIELPRSSNEKKISLNSKRRYKVRVIFFMVRSYAILIAYDTPLTCLRMYNLVITLFMSYTKVGRIHSAPRIRYSALSVYYKSFWLYTWIWSTLMSLHIVQVIILEWS